jgi:hypothetical protein
MTEVNINLGTSLTEISSEAKAWVYTSNQNFTESQLSNIEKYAEVFLSQWDSHGKIVKGNIQVLHNRFIAVFADTEGDTMCGRAQDSSLKFMKELEEILEVKLLDRMLVAINQKGTIETLPFMELRNKITSGEIAKSTTFYNGLVASKEQFLNDWERPIEGSWL